MTANRMVDGVVLGVNRPCVTCDRRDKMSDTLLSQTTHDIGGPGRFRVLVGIPCRQHPVRESDTRGDRLTSTI